MTSRGLTSACNGRATRGLLKIKRIALVVVLLVAGVLLGGFVSWSQRPVEWQLGLLQTARVSVDAATYGHPYESQAEGVLLYFIYGGMLGGVVAVLLTTILTRRLRI